MEHQANSQNTAESNVRAAYVAGGTMPRDSASYLRREGDQKLIEALLASRFCYVLNSRQMGKSSLSVRAMDQLQSQGVATVFIDLTRFGGRTSTPEGWYAGMINEAGRILNLRNEFLAYYKERTDLSPVEKFIGCFSEIAIPKLGKKLVVFIDEIDATRSLPFSCDDFFAAIRSCYNRRATEPIFNQLTFCLLGVATPTDLIQDARTTPFNIGERIYLRDFTLDEAMPLAAGLGRNGVEVVRRIHYWTNGHPFLTQSLCLALSKGSQEISPQSVDALVKSELFEESSKDTNINLADVGNRVLNSNQPDEDLATYRAEILSLYGIALADKIPLIDDDSNRLTSVLKLSGIMRTSGKELKVRNHIYERAFNRKWIEANMPGQEVVRQRKAFLAGVLRTSLVAAAIVLAIGSLAAIAFHESKVARQAEISAKSLAKERKIALNQANAEKEAELKAKNLAQSSAQLAQAQKGIAIENAAEAQTQKSIAMENAADAKRQTDIAISSRNEAQREKTEAQSQSEIAYDQAIQGVDLSLQAKKYDRAQASLVQLASNPNAGWELRYLFYKAMHLEKTLVAPFTGVNQIAYADHGTVIAECDDGGNVAAWNVSSGKMLWQHKICKRQNTGLTVSPDTSTIYVGTNVGTVFAFNAETGKLKWQDLHYTWGVNSIAATRNGKYIWTCSVGLNLIQLDAKNGKILRQPFTPDPSKDINVVSQFTALASSPTANRLVVSEINGRILVFNCNNGKHLVGQSFNEGSTSDPIQDIEFDANGDRFATCTGSGNIAVWQANTDHLIKRFSDPKQGTVLSVWLNKSGEVGFFGDSVGRVFKFDVASGNESEIVHCSSGVASVTQGGSDNSIAIGCQDGGIRIAKISTKTNYFHFSSGPGHPGMAAFSPNLRRLAVATLWKDQKYIYIISCKSHRVIWVKKCLYPGTLVFSPRGNFLMSSRKVNSYLYSDGTQIFDSSNGKLLRTFTAPTPSPIWPEHNRIVFVGATTTCYNPWKSKILYTKTYRRFQNAPQIMGSSLGDSCYLLANNHVTRFAPSTGRIIWDATFPSQSRTTGRSIRYDIPFISLSLVEKKVCHVTPSGDLYFLNNSSGKLVSKSKNSAASASLINSLSNKQVTLNGNRILSRNGLGTQVQIYKPGKATPILKIINLPFDYSKVSGNLIGGVSPQGFRILNSMSRSEVLRTVVAYQQMKSRLSIISQQLNLHLKNRELVSQDQQGLKSDGIPYPFRVNNTREKSIQVIHFLVQHNYNSFHPHYFESEMVQRFSNLGNFTEALKYAFQVLHLPAQMISSGDYLNAEDLAIYLGQERMAEKIAHQMANLYLFQNDDGSSWMSNSGYENEWNALQAQGHLNISQVDSPVIDSYPRQVLTSPPSASRMMAEENYMNVLPLENHLKTLSSKLGPQWSGAYYLYSFATLNALAGHLTSARMLFNRGEAIRREAISRIEKGRWSRTGLAWAIQEILREHARRALGYKPVKNIAAADQYIFAKQAQYAHEHHLP